MIVDIHHTSVPKVGETANGDAVLVRKHHGTTLIALVDALGHGPAAAETAEVAIAHLRALDPIPAIAPLVDGLHRKMHGTRGAAVMVCAVEGARIRGCSIGNVELRSRMSRLPAVPTPGIVGSRIRSPRVFEGDLLMGERLVLFSDGLSARLSASDADGLSGLEACKELLRKHRRPQDDATVIVIDVAGSRSQVPGPRR